MDVATAVAGDNIDHEALVAAIDQSPQWGTIVCSLPRATNTESPTHR